MEQRLTFESLPGEAEDGVLDLSRAVGVSDEDLSELTDGRVIGSVRAERGSVGKGASGPGLALILQLVEEVGNDGAALLALGAAAATVIKKVRSGHGRQVVHVEVPLMTALALAALDEPPQLSGSRFSTCTSITDGDAGAGTDARDVWVSWLILANDDILGLFHGPDGKLIGHVVVPPGWSKERGLIDQGVAKKLFGGLNGASARDQRTSSPD